MRIFAGKDARVLFSLAAVGLIAATVWTVGQVVPRSAERPASMAAMVPQGALLEIESPDFGGLLRDWEHSPEEAAWVKSDNYAVFSRSRLFGRLADAQAQFAEAAGLAPDNTFLNEIAGKNSVFAWYDIGKLEFLYIARLAPGKAEQTRLMQSKSSFSQRQAGKSTFYVRTRDGDGGPRTVTFAVSGDYLLLATREDLMADALGLLEHGSTDSLATEPWFVDAGNAVKSGPGEPVLRMALDLNRLVKTPYFRSYWVQQNVTEMKQYRAARVDLYRESSQMREERVLLPQSAASEESQADLGALVSLVPPGSAVYRAVATGDAGVAVQALEEKLLVRGTSEPVDRRVAPSVDLSEQVTGQESDLETRIDAAPVVADKPEELAKLLRSQIAAAGILGVLAVDSNQTGAAVAGAGGRSMWVPLHSAVVVVAAKDWDQGALEGGLSDALAPQLSAGGLGLVWSAQSGGYAGLEQPQPFFMAVRGRLLLVSDDPSMMKAMLGRVESGGEAPLEARLVAGFDQATAVAAFVRLSGLIDRDGMGGGGTQATEPAGGQAVGSTPRFLADDVANLSRSMQAVRGERVVERRDGPLMRQTVIYLQHP